MLSIFRPLLDRVKALFAVSAARSWKPTYCCAGLNVVLSCCVRRSTTTPKDLHGIANHLRQQAEVVSVQRPLAGGVAGCGTPGWQSASR